MPSWLKGAAGVLLAALLVGVAGYCWGHDAGERAGAATATAGLEARADSLTHQRDAALARAARARVVADSLRRAARADSVHRAALAARITIRSPTVIAVDTSTDISGGASVTPPVLVSVPAQLTDLIQTQARRIQQLQALLAVADSGWADAERLAENERQLRLLRERELAIARANQPRWGLKTGIVLGVLAAGASVYLAGRLD